MNSICYQMAWKRGARYAVCNAGTGAWVYSVDFSYSRAWHERIFDALTASRDRPNESKFYCNRAHR